MAELSYSDECNEKTKSQGFIISGGLSTKVVLDEIRTHARAPHQPETCLGIEVAANFKRRTALDHSTVVALY